GGGGGTGPPGGGRARAPPLGAGPPGPAPTARSSGPRPSRPSPSAARGFAARGTARAGDSPRTDPGEPRASARGDGGSGGHRKRAGREAPEHWAGPPGHFAALAEEPRSP